MEFHGFHQRRQTMRRRLVMYMLVLLAVVLSALVAGLTLMGQFGNDRQELRDKLELQLDFMEKELLTHSDTLAAMGQGMSEAISRTAESVLSRQNLQADVQADTRMQLALLPVLRDFLLRTDASGGYVMLDHGVPTGLYLQKKTLDPAENEMLLYRGQSAVGKQFGIMPHRKWRLEPEAELFEGPESGTPVREYRYTPVFTLPGTSEQAILLQIPVRSPSGARIGSCGFEICQTFFKQHHAQPALYPHLAFLLSVQDPSGSVPMERLAAGTRFGYFYQPSGVLREVEKTGILEFSGEKDRAVGLSREIRFGPETPAMKLSVMLPGEDYDRILRTQFLRMALVGTLLGCFAVCCCVFFSQRYLLPILHGLEQMQTEFPAEQSGVQEINDLIAFLMQKDRQHADAMRLLESETEDARSRAALIQQECETIRQELEKSRTEPIRVAHLQAMDVEAQDYQIFRRGLSELTAKEQEIFQYYLEGKTVPQIQELMGIKETTLRYHNRNIYGKLGVHSMKQLLRFAVYMNETCGEAPRPIPHKAHL